MQVQETSLKKCPLCGAEYGGHSASSRIYPDTYICSDCGTREALTSIGVDSEEQDKILETIHNCRCGE